MSDATSGIANLVGLHSPIVMGLLYKADSGCRVIVDHRTYYFVCQVYRFGILRANIHWSHRASHGGVCSLRL